MEKIRFDFKAYQPGLVPQPLIRAKFEFDGKYDEIICLLDSGADFCTIPQWMAEMNLGLKFENMIAPAEIKNKWKGLDKSNKKEVEKLIKELLEKNVAIPDTYGCACNRKPSPRGYFFPVKLKIGKFENNVLVLWVESSDIQPIIGRLGVFDKVKSVVFNKKDMEGHLVL